MDSRGYGNCGLSGIFRFLTPSNGACMTMSPRALCCTIALASASAGLSSLAAQPPTGGSIGSVKLGPIDACSVLTREEIKTISGKDPGAPRPSGSGATTLCYWEAASPHGSIVLHALGDANYQSMDATLQAMIKQGKKAKKVSVVGEEAIFTEQPGDPASGTLFVKVGHYTLSLWREALPKGTPESVLPTLTTLAKAAIPKLR